MARYHCSVRHGLGEQGPYPPGLLEEAVKWPDQINAFNCGSSWKRPGSRAIKAVRPPWHLEQRMPFNPRRAFIIEAVGLATVDLSVAALVVLFSAL